MNLHTPVQKTLERSREDTGSPGYKKKWYIGRMCEVACI